MATRYFIMWGLLVASISGAQAASILDPDAAAAQLCGLLCGHVVESSPSETLDKTARVRLTRHSHGGKRRKISRDYVPLPKARPENSQLSQMNQPEPTQPKPSTDALETSPTLASVVELAERLTTDANRYTQKIISEARSSIGTDIETTGSVPADDPRVVLVVAKHKIDSITQLSGRLIALDGDLYQSGEAIRTALVAAGATQVQISEGQTRAIDRLSRDEVPAAILGLVLRDAANKVPEVDSYHIFRIPLSPG